LLSLVLAPLLGQGYARSSAADGDDSDDESNDEDDDADPNSPWFGGEVEEIVFYDEIDQQLRDRTDSHLNSPDDTSASPSVAYAFQNLPPISNTAFSKARHTAQVSSQLNNITEGIHQ